MSQLLSARAMVSDALRKIGAYTTSDSGPDGNELAIGLSSLDTVLGHKLAITRFPFMLPSIYSVSLTGGTQSYDLMTSLAGDWPPDGLMMPVDAFLVDSADNRTPIQIARRDQWDQLDQTQTGSPSIVYFDRSDNTTITMRTWPTLTSGLTGYSIEITAQKFAPRISGPVTSPTVQTGLPQSFSMWGIYELAAFLGDGTIRRLPASEVKEYRDMAASLWGELFTYAARENADDTIAQPWGA